MIGRGITRHLVALLLLLGSSSFGQQSVDALRADATRLIETRDFDGASKALRRAVRLYPHEDQLWNLLGISEGELGRLDSSRDSFQRGLRYSPKSVFLHENLGFLYYREANYDSAKRYLKQAVSLGSRNPGVFFSLAASRARTGERKQALVELKALETALSSNADYWIEFGWIQLPDDPDSAEFSFSRALALTPENIRALNRAATAAELQQLDEKALSFLLRAKRANPNDLSTLIHLGKVCLRRDLTIDALSLLEQAYKLAPSSNTALYYYARAQIGVQQWQKAYDLFSEFTRRAPRFASAYYALGWLDLKLNRRAEARRNLEHSLQLSPDSVDPLCELGQLDLEEGDLDSAQQRLGQVLEREPQHAKANAAYGDILLKRGKLEEAIARFESAIQSDPQSGVFHYKLSTVLFRMNRVEQAEQERALGTRLNTDALKSSKTVLRLASPDGTLLSETP